MYSPSYGSSRVVSHLLRSICVCVRVSDVQNQCLGQEFALNQPGFFIVWLLRRFQSFALAPDFVPVGALPPAHWAGMPGRQGVENIPLVTGSCPPTMCSSARRYSCKCCCWTKRAGQRRPRATESDSKEGGGGSSGDGDSGDGDGNKGDLDGEQV